MILKIIIFIYFLKKILFLAKVKQALWMPWTISRHNKAQKDMPAAKYSHAPAWQGRQNFWTINSRQVQQEFKETKKLSGLADSLSKMDDPPNIHVIFSSL